MMQSRRQHGSSGELDVFGATSYFVGLPDYCPSERPADRRLMIQAAAKVVPDEQQLGLDDDERHAQLGLGVAKSSSGKSKLAALFSFMTSPSPRASFRKESPPPPLPPPTTNKLRQAGDEPAKVSSSSRESISVRLQGCCGGVHELDLGVAMGDRRLQGVRVVRGIGDVERWVVRCSAWDDEEHHEKMFDAESSDDHNKEEVEEGDDDGNHGGWESDSSSDLFDLDLLSTHAADLSS
ncbi:hypothetical protein BAE44_0004166 [Dichanthelium oligosanthes]|uniref:Uncharacterized protein n=1 Tax=Dichanthelium oligosanthes TaxID=888268 RepID=A0A1E5WBS5_9POAL|nr:hypothetical protein BAE44_0004166 [Dichanthelium oligosanthes]